MNLPIGVILQAQKLLNTKNLKPINKYLFVKNIRDTYFPHLTLIQTTDMLFELTNTNSKYSNKTKDELMQLRETIKYKLKQEGQNYYELLTELEEINKILHQSNVDIEKMIIDIYVYLNLCKIRVSLDDIKQMTLEDIEAITERIKEVYKNVE